MCWFADCDWLCVFRSRSSEAGTACAGLLTVIGCVCSEVGHLKQERRVLVHSLSLAEFNDVTMQNVLSQDSCEELKIHFVRPKDRPQDWSG